MEFEKIKDILSEQLGISQDDLTMDSAIEDLGVDSLDLVEIIMALESEYDIDISDDDVEKIKTVGDIVNYIKDKTL